MLKLVLIGHLVDPLKKSAASLCCGRVTVQGMLVPLWGLRWTFMNIEGRNQNVPKLSLQNFLFVWYKEILSTITPMSYLGV